MASNISGVGLFEVIAGTILIWSGLKGEPVADIVRQAASGQEPTGTNTEQITTTAYTAPDINVGSSSGSLVNTSGSAGGSAAVNQGIARMLAIANGYSSWTTGQQWSDWVSLWNRESGWSASARNQSSGAYGIAQALGHGGSNTAAANGTNEYGAEYGLTVAEAVAANGGNASDQILWGIGYIAAVYGSPSGAWAEEESAGAY